MARTVILPPGTCAPKATRICASQTPGDKKAAVSCFQTFLRVTRVYLLRGEGSIVRRTVGKGGNCECRAWSSEVSGIKRLLSTSITPVSPEHYHISTCECKDTTLKMLFLRR